MGPVRVREPKLPLVVGILCEIFFGSLMVILLIGGILSRDGESLAMAFFFGVFAALGVFMLCSYFRRELVIDKGHMTYRPSIGRRREFYYLDIQSVKFNGLKFEIRSRSGKRLAVFEANMIGSESAAACLQELGVKFERTGLLKVGDMSAGSISAKFSARTEAEKRAELSFIRSKWSEQQMDRQRLKSCRISRFLTGVLVVSLLSGGIWQMIGFLFILMSGWAMYLWLYPRLAIEAPKGEAGRYYVPIPGISCAAAMVFLLLSTKSINDNESSLFLFTAVSMCMLLIPYFLVLIVRRPGLRAGKFLAAAVTAFALAYSMARPINIIATFQAPVHETVKVISTSSSRSSAGTSYYVVAERKGTEETMKISKELYESVGEEEEVQLCKKTSVFGYTYWTLHR